MTLLRRTAQLVEDLRTLNVIKENDDVKFQQFCDGCVDLEISFNGLSHISLSDDSTTIKYALEKEFGEPNIVRLEYNRTHVYCNILPHCCNH